jgi:flagellar P-ring protein precursor FlgI
VCAAPIRTGRRACIAWRPTTLARALAAALLVVLLPGSGLRAEVRIRHICQVKGQEENQLVGIGLVVGLQGTGDGGRYLPTMRSLAAAMEALGVPQLGKTGLAELKDARNVALVVVTATIPRSGGLDGITQVDCRVSCIGAAKSLAGGVLFPAPLTGSRPQSDPQKRYVLAYAQGPIQIDDSTPTTGTIRSGCQLTHAVTTPFYETRPDGSMRVTLVVDKHRAGWGMAQEVADTINEFLGEFRPYSRAAQAMGPGVVELVIPPVYQSRPAEFLSIIMDLPLFDVPTTARVVIDERSGAVVITGDVEIGPAVISHKNLVLDTGAQGAAERFVGVDTQQTSTTKLKSLVETLNAINLPSKDIVEIIKKLDRAGAIHGWVETPP